MAINTHAQRPGSGGGSISWFDDENYLQMGKDKKGNAQMMKINARTGKSAPYKAVKQTVTATPAGNRKFSPDGKLFAYTNKNNLYVVDVQTGRERRLTSDGSDVIMNGYSSWVYMEEILGRGSGYNSYWWSPDGEKLAFLRFDDSPVPQFPIYRARGQHGELEIQRYPKPGDPNPKVKLGVIHVKTGNTVWMDTDYEVDQYIAWPYFTNDSKQLLFQVINRDQNKLEFFLGSVDNGKNKRIYLETQNSWVDFIKDLYLMKDGSGFILRSDRDKWYDLYYYLWDGTLKARLTDSDWRVTRISKVDEETGVIYFTGRGNVNTSNHFFKVNIDGTGFKQLTEGEGSHSVNLSANGSYFIDNYSNVSTPPVTNLYRGDGTFIKEISKSNVEEFDPSKHVTNKLIRVKSDDGKFDLPVNMALPPNFDENTKYPVLFQIYGGPNAGGASDSWRGYRNAYAEQGIIVVGVAHRSSGLFGKEGLDYMHRSLGKWEMFDWISVVKWLEKQSYVDPDKTGITGGSYGGYITAFALTYGADYFEVGVAGSSVISWELYDNVYTERYMDTPQQNPEGYKFGSCVTHVPNFKGKLLITHGLMDDNVHQQNTVHFISAMQDEGKDFEMMMYPDNRHGIGGKKGQHARNNSQQFLLKHLLGKDFEF